MNKNKYWQKRVNDEMKARDKIGDTITDEIKKLHDYYFENIQKDIESFYQRYATKNNLDIIETKKRVSEFDVQAFQDKAKRYVQEKNFSSKANSELSIYNLKMKVNRLEMLLYHLDLEAVALADEEKKLTERFLNEAYNEEVKFQAGLLGRFVADPKYLENMANAVINTPFKGAKWSKNIWRRQNELRKILNREVRTGLLKGLNPVDIVGKLRKEFDVSVFDARRLAITEYARVQSEVQKQNMIANGFEKYIFLPEASACKICEPLSNKIFLVSEMTPGENCSPMHPHCRCSTAPYFERSKTDEIHNDILFKIDLSDKAKEAVSTSFSFFNNKEVVLRKERLEHILEGHSDIGDNVERSLKQVIKEPLRILIDHKNKNSLLVLGKDEQNKLNVVVKLSNNEKDNSIITAMRVSDKTIKRLIKKNKQIYDKNG